MEDVNSKEWTQHKKGKIMYVTDEVISTLGTPSFRVNTTFLLGGIRSRVVEAWTSALTAVVLGAVKARYTHQSPV